MSHRRTRILIFVLTNIIIIKFIPQHDFKLKLVTFESTVWNLHALGYTANDIVNKGQMPILMGILSVIKYFSKEQE